MFSSSHLPITIVQTDEADYIYKKLLGSELLAVPCGGLQRLAEWPGLHAADSIIEVNGLGWKTCCADIILSSAGKFLHQSGAVQVIQLSSSLSKRCQAYHA